MFSAVPIVMKADEDTSVIHYINQTLAQAFQRRASDIHFEPMPDNYRVRMRIDGMLHICTPLP
ncbi:MAG: ATPase, T2SS/T4P/T4SS family [Candidatus Malihini olakiniferum]